MILLKTHHTPMPPSKPFHPIDSIFRIRGWSAVAISFVLTSLLGSTFSLCAQESPVASAISFDATGRVAVRVAATPNTYSVLLRGNDVLAIETPVAVEVEGNLPGALPIELIDPESPLESNARFYRVTQHPVGTPGDLDQDGVDDLYELARRPVLHPLIATDAALDHDGDRRATVDEYRVGTDPLVYDVALGTVAVPMPTLNTPFDPNPTNPAVSLVQKLLVYAYDTDGNAIPTKTIAIKNNAPFTVYPVMRDGNEAVTSTNPAVGLYDPYDPVETEYRGYIGYQGTDGQYYFGLQSGQTITIRVPLVFWNGTRMGIVTDGRYLAPPAGQPNPLQYDVNAQRVIATAESTGPNPADPKTNGVVMWYRTALLAPALDSPDQLLEWTMRDQAYLSNPQINARTFGEIPASEKVTLINYDVSYVDNMFLPVAMEALDVPVPAPPVPFNQNRGPYGWIGSTNPPSLLQGQILAFTSPSNSLLGTYFGTNGWPIYNIPPDPAGEVKIPAGQNIFAQSPLAAALSSYDVSNNHFMLSSGGTGPIKVNIGGQGTAASGTVLTLSPNEEVSKVRALGLGFTVVGYAPAGQANPIQPGTKVTQVLHVSTGPGDPSQVELDKPLVATQDGCNFDFFRPVSDYASDAIIRLWFSWAQHYLNLTQDVPSQTVLGSVENNGATLRFAAPVTGLVEGMQVTGAGLDAANPSQEKGGVIVLSIAPNQRSVILSQLARADHPLSDGQQYTFQKPQPLPVTPTNLYTFDFSQDPVETGRDPSEFAKKVYLVMGSMAQIPKNPDPKVVTPHVLDLMNNVIGGNMGFIFDTNARRFAPEGLAISARIRDMIKSVLRGVTDFTRYPEFSTDNVLNWYPAPSVSRGGLTFNAYNLDPFVWFVHVPLGFSGYGFSLDDDTADVGAGEATQLQVTIGGYGGLVNTNEWTIQAVYGPVTGPGNWDPAKTVSFYDVVTNASNASPIVITAPRHDLSNGETVYIDQVEGNTAANGKWTVANVTADTLELVGSSGNGNYTSGGRWSRGPLPFISGVDPLNVYWKLKGDDRQAGFTGALLSGPGVLKKGSVRIAQLGDNQLGILALNTYLTNSTGGLLPAGTYTWTFTGK